MSFNKTFVSEDVIKQYLNNGLELKKLFNSDTIIFLDDTSSKVYKLYKKGLSNDEINVKLFKYG